MFITQHFLVVFEYLLKLEIIVFLLSGSYIIYYIWEKVVEFHDKIQKLVNPSTYKPRRKKEEDAIEERNEVRKTLKTGKETSDINIEEYKREKRLSEEEKERLNEIIKKVKVHSEKSYFDTAKGLIIEWLAIDKFNKDLNLELAHIYEQEKNFRNAEYIYRDIVDIVKNNDEILKKLGYVLALQKKFPDSIEIYERLFHKNAGDMDVVELLSDLHYEVENYSHSMKYVLLSLKEKPRNVDRLLMKADILKREGKWEESITTFRQILELQPYNSLARDGIKEIEKKIKEKKEKGEAKPESTTEKEIKSPQKKWEKK